MMEHYDFDDPNLYNSPNVHIIHPAPEKKKKKLRFTRMTPALTVAVLFLVCVIVFRYQLFLQPEDAIEIVGSFSSKPLLYLLNALPVFVITWIIWLLLGNVFVSSAISILIFGLLSYANLLKIEGRNDPLVPLDLTLIREAMQSTKEYGLDLHIGKLALLIVIVVIFLAIAYFVRGAKQNKKDCYKLAAGLAVALCLSVRFVYTSDALYSNFHVPSQYNLSTVYNALGFNYSFLHNYQISPIEKPKGFAKADMEAREAAFVSEVNSVQPNIIVVMCEAFSDLSDEEVFNYSESTNPLMFYHKLQAQNGVISGQLNVPGFAAGTANTEFDVMTGMQTNLLGGDNSSSFRVVRGNTTNIGSVLKDNGYYCKFMHPGLSWFYNRNNVYNHFGFDAQTFLDTDFAYPDDYHGSNISDQGFLKQLKDDISAAAENKTPLFEYSVTMQNHQNYTSTKYSSWVTIDDVPLKRKLSDESYEKVSVYMEGVRDSAHMVHMLGEYLDTLDEPYLLVFYGDHRPNLGEAYTELGLDYKERLTTDGVISSYNVPFLIKANKAYEKTFDFEEKCEDLGLYNGMTISANYMGALLLDYAGYGDADPYFSYLNDARKQIPVLRYGEEMCILADGSSVTELPSEADEIAQNIREWSYYRLKFHK